MGPNVLFIRACFCEEIVVDREMSACVDSLSLALGQISFAVNDLTKKNYKATLKEINEVSFQMKVVFSVDKNCVKD